MKPHQVTEEHRKEMIRLYLMDKKMSLREIGRKLGCSVGTVSYYIKKAGIKIKSKSQLLKGRIITKEARQKIRKALSLFTKEQQVEIIRLYIEEKKSCKEISKIVKCESATILNYLKRNNIKRRRISDAIKLNPPSTIFKKGSKINLGRKRLDITGENNKWWKGGKYTTKTYTFVLSKKHPFCNKKGYMSEHRLVMEKHLGRYLTPQEVVHHFDFNKQNSQIDNLHLFKNNPEHSKYHHFLKRLILNEKQKGMCKKTSILELTK